MAFGARAAVAATSATADDPSSLDGMASFYVMLAYFAATLLDRPHHLDGGSGRAPGHEPARARPRGPAPRRPRAGQDEARLHPRNLRVRGRRRRRRLDPVRRDAARVGCAVLPGTPDGGRRDVGGGRGPPRRGARHDPPGRPVLVAGHAQGRDHTPGRRTPHAGGPGERGRPRPRPGPPRRVADRRHPRDEPGDRDRHGRVHGLHGRDLPHRQPGGRLVDQPHGPHHGSGLAQPPDDGGRATHGRRPARRVALLRGGGPRRVPRGHHVSGE